MKRISKVSLRTPLASSTVRCATASIVLVGAVAACKGEKVMVPVPDENMKRDLEACNAKIALCKTIEDEYARLQREGTGSEIVVAIEGNALVVKPSKPSDPPRPIDDKAASEASKQFIDVVARSRGAIQKCYEQALKKNTGLQSRTITLTVSASFSQAGAYRNATFASPIALGDTFDTCIRTVASKWSLPQSSPAMTFKAQVSLTPS
jgi:hypothetical protein